MKNNVAQEQYSSSSSAAATCQRKNRRNLCAHSRCAIYIEGRTCERVRATFSQRQRPHASAYSNTCTPCSFFFFRHLFVFSGTRLFLYSRRACYTFEPLARSRSPPGPLTTFSLFVDSRACELRLKGLARAKEVPSCKKEGGRE